MEERREQLGLAATDAELAHPAVVHPDAGGLAVSVEAAELVQAPDAAGLDVDDPDLDRDGGS